MLNDELSAALENAAASQPFEPDYVKALTRSRRTRSHRRWAAAAGATLAVTGIAVGVVAVIPTPRDNPSVLIPAASPVPVLASVDGIDVTWLPTGLRPLPIDATAADKVGGLDGPTVSLNFARTSGGTSSVAPTMTISVQRGSEVDLNKIAPQVSAGTSVTGLTVRGHRALLLTSGGATPEYILLWVEKTGYLLASKVSEERRCPISSGWQPAS